jgi:5-methylcytosine-specific restriction endonuclease McrA
MLMTYFTLDSLNFKPKTRSQRDRFRKLKRAVENTGGCWCHICGEKIPENEVTIDHVHPLSKGGLDSTANIRLAHEKCNRDRSNIDILYYRMFHYIRQNIVQDIAPKEVKCRLT